MTTPGGGGSVHWHGQGAPVPKSAGSSEKPIFGQISTATRQGPGGSLTLGHSEAPSPSPTPGLVPFSLLQARLRTPVTLLDVLEHLTPAALAAHLKPHGPAPSTTGRAATTQHVQAGGGARCTLRTGVCRGLVGVHF